MLAFIPVFFFASLYAQVALGKSSSEAGLYLLYFFIGFVIAAQIGGRMLDRIGAKRPVVLGCALAAVGFWLWAGKVTDLNFSAQQWYVILAGGGMGFMLGPASTDAVNRASRFSYGEATGITQTVRNYAASLGLAILGTLLVSQLRSHVTSSLTARGVPAARASQEASSISQFQGGSTQGTVSIPTSSGSTSPTPHAPCSTRWRYSWPWRRSWPWQACGAAVRRNPGRSGRRTARAAPRGWTTPPRCIRVRGPDPGWGADPGRTGLGGGGRGSAGRGQQAATTAAANSSGRSNGVK